MTQGLLKSSDRKELDLEEKRSIESESSLGPEQETASQQLKAEG